MLTKDRRLRVERALAEARTMLARLEGRYEARPEHLRTAEDVRLIEFYRAHAARLETMLT